MQNGLSELRNALWEAARGRPEELALAARELFGQSPGDSDEWTQLLDLVATEWVLTDGSSLPQLHSAELDAWTEGVRTSLWVVDGHEGDLVLLRDVQDDAEYAVACPASARAELTRRTVLHARLLPWRGGYSFFGEPGLYGEMGVIARMQLLEQYRAGPEPDLLARLRALRGELGRQRSQQRAFARRFGHDLARFPSAEALEEAMADFLHAYLHEEPASPAGGPTRAQQFAAARGKEPPAVELRMGETLREGRPAVWFDASTGAWFLPRFGELEDQLQGRSAATDAIELYLSEAELPVTALQRAGPTVRVAALLGRPDAPLSELLPDRPAPSPRTPRRLPEFEDVG